MENSFRDAYQELNNHFKSIERDMSHMFDFTPSFPKMIASIFNKLASGLNKYLF